MSAADIVSRLDKVKQTGPGRWLACCPAHEDKRPSLSVRELDDGRMLLYCFGGCDVDAIISAIGLSVTDLFPQRLPGHRLSAAPRIPAGDILQAVAFELEVFVCAAAELATGSPLAADDHARLRLAASRLRNAVGVAHGYR